MYSRHAIKIFPIFFSLYLGAWHQVQKDKFKAKKERTEEYLDNNLHFAIKGVCTVTYKFLKRLMKVFAMYLDLTTDTILLARILTVLDEDINDYQKFSSQVAIILLISIVVPLFISALTIAFRSPLILLRSDLRNALRGNKIVISIMGILTVLLFPLMPAIIVISHENAKDERKALKGKNQDKEKFYQVPVLKKCEDLTEYIKESQSGFSNSLLSLFT